MTLKLGEWVHQEQHLREKSAVLRTSEILTEPSRSQNVLVEDLSWASIERVTSGQ